MTTPWRRFGGLWNVGFSFSVSFYKKILKGYDFIWKFVKTFHKNLAHVFKTTQDFLNIYYVDASLNAHKTLLRYLLFWSLVCKRGNLCETSHFLVSGRALMILWSVTLQPGVWPLFWLPTLTIGCLHCTALLDLQLGWDKAFFFIPCHLLHTTLSLSFMA